MCVITATGNLLDNANLIQTLENAKAKSVSIAEQLEEMHSTADEIEKVTAGYRPVAKRGSILYVKSVIINIVVFCSTGFYISFFNYLTDIFQWRVYLQFLKCTNIPYLLILNYSCEVYKNLIKILYCQIGMYPNSSFQILVFEFF